MINVTISFNEKDFESVTVKALLTELQKFSTINVERKPNQYGNCECPPGIAREVSRGYTDECETCGGRVF